MQYSNTPWRPEIAADDEKKYINMQYSNTPWRQEIFAGDEKKYMNMQQVALFPDQVSELWSPLRMLCCIIFKSNILIISTYKIMKRRLLCVLF